MKIPTTEIIDKYFGHGNNTLLPAEKIKMLGKLDANMMNSVEFKAHLADILIRCSIDKTSIPDYASSWLMGIWDGLQIAKLMKQQDETEELDKLYKQK